MVDSTQRNAWVDKYLTALLGDGLSKEYVARDEDGADNDAVAANYFFNLIIDDAEDGIVASWRRAKVRIVFHRGHPSTAVQAPRHPSLQGVLCASL